MELLIIGGLAFVGYEISKTGKTKLNVAHKQNIQQQNEYPFKSDPRNGIDPANMNFNTQQPFFKREGGMTLSNNNEIKTRNLESFTGINNEEYKKKQEQVCLFNPEDNKQNIYGTPAISSDIYNRYKSNSMMNNVNPVEQQQVGPGLNTGSDVSAKGGFHQYLRILPTNVGDYKNNTLEGRVISGKGMTQSRTAQSHQEVHSAASYYTQCEHPTMPSKAAYNAPTHQSVITPENTNRGDINNHVGTIKGSTALQSNING